MNYTQILEKLGFYENNVDGWMQIGKGEDIIIAVKTDLAEIEIHNERTDGYEEFSGQVQQVLKRIQDIL